jgi:hypothetical protein
VIAVGSRDCVRCESRRPSGPLFPVGSRDWRSISTGTGSLVLTPMSTPQEPVLELYFNRVPAGRLSNRLSCLSAGDSLWVAPRAAGWLTLAQVPQGEHLWLLPTGTAIGPFLSILKSAEPWARLGGPRSWRAHGSGPQLSGHDSGLRRPVRGPIFEGPLRRPRGHGSCCQRAYSRRHQERRLGGQSRNGSECRPVAGHDLRQPSHGARHGAGARIAWIEEKPPR